MGRAVVALSLLGHRPICGCMCCDWQSSRPALGRANFTARHDKHVLLLRRLKRKDIEVDLWRFEVPRSRG